MKREEPGERAEQAFGSGWVSLLSLCVGGLDEPLGPVPDSN